MGCRYEWADESQIIMNLYLEAPWTWEEYMQVSTEVFALIRAVDHPCATAVDVTHMGALPKGNVLAHLQHVERTMPENVFASVIAGTSILVNTFMNILMKIRPGAKNTAMFAPNLEEAHTLIMERYHKLHPEAKKSSG